jgi:hypothetical protein
MLQLTASAGSASDGQIERIGVTARRLVNGALITDEVTVKILFRATARSFKMLKMVSRRRSGNGRCRTLPGLDRNPSSSLARAMRTGKWEMSTLAASSRPWQCGASNRKFYSPPMIDGNIPCYRGASTHSPPRARSSRHHCFA